MSTAPCYVDRLARFRAFTLDECGEWGVPSTSSNDDSSDPDRCHRHGTLETPRTRSPVESADGVTFKLRGDLSLHGVVLEVELSDAEQKDPYGNLRRGASAMVKVEIELALIKA